MWRQCVTRAVMSTQDMSVLASLLRDARRARFESPPAPPLCSWLPSSAASRDWFSLDGRTRTNTARRQRHTASVHRGRPRCPARPGSHGRHVLAACRCTACGTLGIPTLRGSAPRVATLGESESNTHGLPHLVLPALPPRRSGDAAAYGLVCEWARAHDLRFTTAGTAVACVLPLTIRT